MKVSYVEGLATHNGSESCVGVREDEGEALTGVRAGRVLSREIHALPRERQVLRDGDGAEGRGLAKGNSPERNALRTQGRGGAPSALERVRQAARKDRKQRFTALLPPSTTSGDCAQRTWQSRRMRRQASTARRGSSTGRS